MESQPWRWMNGMGDGATHMALDSAMLQNPSQLEVPTLRVYQWTPPCISLGYHQKLEELDLSYCKALGVEVVIRPTGGRAVFHEGELTYSMVIPKACGLASVVPSLLFLRIAHALVLAMKNLGVSAKAVKKDRTFSPSRGPYCFASSGRYEIEVNQKKLIGSAQRMTKYGVLHQGSILLDQRHLRIVQFFALSESDKSQKELELKQNTTTLKNCLGGNPDISGLKEAIRNGFENEFSIQFEPTFPTPKEMDLAKTLRSHYGVIFSGG